MSVDLDPQTSRWHQDRRIPLATIATVGVGLLLQGGAFLYYAGQSEQRLTQVESIVVSRSSIIERFFQLESAVGLDRRTISERLDRIENKLDRVIVGQE